ncbi:hypothetical protein A2635_02510 [Candidatus Peribacteria bacterium RIFCSPHIGHO2_01_FULL_51_9]|nr:MAG: hypothetical protein A2635_02510 [Candidatus Peribacteria bacterium RIFCSPHIGHO2_01_FULL_51_9]
MREVLRDFIESAGCCEVGVEDHEALIVLHEIFDVHCTEVFARRTLFVRDRTLIPFGNFPFEEDVCGNGFPRGVPLFFFSAIWFVLLDEICKWWKQLESGLCYIGLER